MPTPHRMKYFHAASRLAGVRYSDTSSTVVSATRKTLNGSTRNWAPNASSGPVRTTRIVSATAAANVHALAATLTAGAIARCPTSASSAAPITGAARTKTISTTFVASLFLQLLEMLEIEAVELLADLEE